MDLRAVSIRGDANRERLVESDFELGLSRAVDDVIRSTPGMSDHRTLYPWLSSSLGDPHAGIWFVAENPSLTQVERARDPDGGPPTTEAQWYTSRGDKLFREALVNAGFKDGDVSSRGGWRCYITNLIKEPAYVGRWNADPERASSALFRWAPVLRWQVETSKPSLVVFMGRKAAGMAATLAGAGAVTLPATMTVDHYSYVAMRPRGRQGPMHPERVAEYMASFRATRRRLEELTRR